MKLLIILTFIFGVTFSFGQNTQNKDTIELPKYDTITFNISSTNSFYFANKLYAIPRNCDDKDKRNCCYFSAQILERNEGISLGSINCDNGTFFHWTVYDTEENAKRYFENTPISSKGQSLKYEKEDVSFFVCDKKVNAFKQIATSFQGYKYESYVFYGIINGQVISGKLSLNNKEKSSSELSPFFQQFFRF